jgi:hypothetical protein
MEFCKDLPPVHAGQPPQRESARAGACGLARAHVCVVDHFWTASGRCLDHVWVIFGPCVGHVWTMFGPCLDHVWAMFGPCLCRILIMFGRFAGHVWAMVLHVGTMLGTGVDFYALAYCQ